MCGPTARPWRWGRSRRRGHKGPSCARPRRRPPWAGLGRASRRASAGAALGAKGQEPSCAGAPRSCCAAGPAPRPSPRPPCSCREGAAAPGRRGGAVVGGHRRRRCPGEGPRRRGGQERARARLRSAPRRPRPAPARQGMMAPGLGPWLLALALAAGPAGVWAQLRLLEAGGGLRAPGDSVLLSCRGAGFAFGTYSIWWYRQRPGDRLEWVSAISFDSSYIKYGHSVQGRATVSRDNSRSESSLSLRSLGPRDSARYFCAVRTGTGNPAEL
ncbi:uncharacterized protein LOC141934239 isoform X1 [Strix aluco]|uniref:uncharacterized protein LOC141934237 isoform X1 n=1 Tax=Strix aluco TaxID=111821 RepID=UPI003DA2E966